jgi:hypothetical protein
MEEYRPTSTNPSFPLPTFLLPTESLRVFAADPTPDLEARYLQGAQTLFCVHPQILADGDGDPYLEWLLSEGLPAEPLEVAPTSSTRTLHVQGTHPPHALKVHFPFRVSRYGRRMREEVLEQAITVSWDLQSNIDAFGPGFAFLREVLGVSLARSERDEQRGENWGYLIREMEPFPPSRQPRHLVPGFALYGRDRFEPETPLLVLELMEGKDPLRFLLEEIMLPVIESWILCYRTLGYLLEPHGQNVLLELGTDRRVHRIVFRDLNLGIDNRRRRDLRLPSGGSNRYNQMETGAFASITYDKFMGGHFFDHLLANVIPVFPALDLDAIRGACRERFQELFPDHGRYLPGTVHYFSETRDRFDKPAFLDTGQPPVWRP